MAIVKDIAGFPVLMVRGKLGRPNGLGFHALGWSILGDRMDGAGIYQRNGRWDPNRIVRMKHYRGHNPQTEVQQAWRAVFASGVQAWHNLSDEEQLVFRSLAHPKSRNGFQRFMRQYLHSHSS